MFIGPGLSVKKRAGGRKAFSWIYICMKEIFKYEFSEFSNNNKFGGFWEKQWYLVWNVWIYCQGILSERSWELDTEMTTTLRSHWSAVLNEKRSNLIGGRKVSNCEMRPTLAPRSQLRCLLLFWLACENRILEKSKLNEIEINSRITKKCSWILILFFLFLVEFHPLTVHGWLVRGRWILAQKGWKQGIENTPHYQNVLPCYNTSGGMTNWWIKMIDHSGVLQKPERCLMLTHQEREIHFGEEKYVRMPMISNKFQSYLG